jgi:hypothetical protein
MNKKFLTIVLICIFVILFSSSAFANIEKTIKEEINNATNGLTEEITQLKEDLSKDPSDYNPGMWSMAETMFEAMLPIGLSLAAMFFIIELLTKSYNFEHFRLETILKAFVKLYVVKAVIENSFMLLQKIFTITSSMIVAANQLGDIKDPAASLDVAIIDKIQDYSAFDKAVFLATLQPWTFILKLVQIIVMVILWGRFFEIYVYTAIAPIPLSTLMNEELRGTGKRFLQSYVGVCFQGVIIIIACTLYGAMMVQVSSTADSWYVLKSLVVTSLVLLFVLVKSSSWAKQITGA